MTLLRGRRQRPPPDRALELLEEIPDAFNDDGCSNAPDRIWWFGWWWFRWACRIHDWRYCTRCHRAGSMTAGARKWGDTELGIYIRVSCPWWAKTAISRAYRFFVWRYGGVSAFDSCGPEAGLLCRHGMPAPEWMTAQTGPREEISC